MDDDLLNLLGKALRSLERDGPELDELIVPRTPSAGENAGVAAQRGKSKPPVVVPMLDVKLETLRLLSFWGWQLHASCPEVDVPVDSVAGWAAYLRRHLLVLESAPWARMCAQEVVAQSRFVADVVSPPASASDPAPLEVGGVREIVSWAQLLGKKVSVATVYRWVASGEIPSETAPDGRTLIELSAVLEKCPDLAYSYMRQRPE